LPPIGDATGGILFYWPPGEFMMDRVEHVNYRNMITLLFQTVPEAKIAYKLWEMPGEPLPYIVFSFLEESFFTPLVNSATDDELKGRVFRFFERMAASSDAKVVDLLAIGLFEAWATNGALVASFEQMGPQTKAVARKAVKSIKPRIFLD